MNIIKQSLYIVTILVTIYSIYDYLTLRAIIDSSENGSAVQQAAAAAMALVLPVSFYILTRVISFMAAEPKQKHRKTKSS